jgi:hypothetical protein
MDVLAPPRPEPKRYGNDPAHLRSCLERGGFFVLLSMVDRGELTAHGAAIQAGIRQGREPLGSGSQNRARTRAWKVKKAYEDAKRAGVPLGAGDLQYWQDDAFPAVALRRGNGAAHPRRAAMPDLAAVIAEWEQAQKPAVKETLEPPRRTAPAPAELPPELALPAHPTIPCTSCREPQQAAALREILDLYLCAVRGEPHRTGSVLPGACCQRRLLGRLDVKALVA